MQKIFAGLLFLCLSLLPVQAQDYPRGTVQSALNITTQTVVKPANGVLVAVTINTGSTTLAINDSATTGGVAASNVIFSGTVTVGTVLIFNFPYLNGLVVNPAAGSVSVAYE
jgi:hypothetical protein